MQGLNLKSPDYQLMERTLHALKENSAAWPFQEPVNLEEVPDYLDVIKQPMGRCHFLAESLCFDADSPLQISRQWERSSKPTSTKTSSNSSTMLCSSLVTVAPTIPKPPSTQSSPRRWRRCWKIYFPATSEGSRPQPTSYYHLFLASLYYVCISI